MKELKEMTINELEKLRDAVIYELNRKLNTTALTLRDITTELDSYMRRTCVKYNKENLLKKAKEIFND